MLKSEDINHLSDLARIAITDTEKTEFLPQLDTVLGYVSELSNITTEEDATLRAGDLRNVLREDADAYEGGTWTEKILNNMPKTEDGYLKVEQIL